jgi:hypothetical protein
MTTLKPAHRSPARRAGDWVCPASHGRPPHPPQRAVRMKVALQAWVSAESQQAAAPPAPSWRCRESESPSRAAKKWSPSSATTAAAAPGWTNPELDALRAPAEAGLIERVWCPSPDWACPRLRLPSHRFRRVNCHGLSGSQTPCRWRTTRRPSHSPGAGCDRQVRTGEDRQRYRRGKLLRSRIGEVLAWPTADGGTVAYPRVTFPVA